MSAKRGAIEGPSSHRRRRIGLPVVTRHLALVALAVVAATGLLGIPAGASEVRAASPDLTIVTSAQYDVQPDQHRVRVTVDMVLTNHLRDTTTRRFYFDKAFLAVLPSASGYRLTWSGSGTPSVHVSKRTASYQVLQFNLAARLYSGKTARYRLRFDLVDKGGSATRDVRVGTALVSFPVWAYATDSTSGSSARVVFPKGFQAEVQAGTIPAPTVDGSGRVIFYTGALSKPLTFFAYLVADRPAAYKERQVSATIGTTTVDLTIRGWPDDAAWSKRVGALVAKGLPVLSGRIGLPWPRDGGLVIQEAVSRATGGYAGLFDPSQGHVEVAYFADDTVVLHESAHAWFNGSLLVDRWANEAFASYYGLEAAKALKIKAKPVTLTADLKAAAIPLNAWGEVGREATATEDYAYAATLVLAREIAKRAGDEGLQAVWADAAGRIGAYQPPTTTAGGPTPEPETVAGPPDWRGLLDLLEAHSSASYADLWRTWVVRPSDDALLDARAAARQRYDEVLAEAGDWQLPRAIRDAMRAWRFDDATASIADAETILDERASLEAATAASGLTAPATLKTAFEGPGGIPAALAEAASEHQAIARYDDAVATRIASPNLVQMLGLFDTSPESALASARTAFAAGDLAKSVADASSAAATWTTAESLGRGRILSLGLLALAIVLALALLGYRLASRRRRGVMIADDATS